MRTSKSTQLSFRGYMVGLFLNSKNPQVPKERNKKEASPNPHTTTKEKHTNHIKYNEPKNKIKITAFKSRNGHTQTHCTYNHFLKFKFWGKAVIFTLVRM